MCGSSRHGLKIFGASWETCEDNNVRGNLEYLKTESLLLDMNDTTYMDIDMAMGMSSNDSTRFVMADVLLTHVPPKNLDLNRFDGRRKSYFGS